MSRSLEGEPRPPQVVTTNLTTPFSGKTSTPNLQNRQLPRPPHNNTPKTPTQNCQTVNDCKLQPTQTPAPPKMSELTTRSIHHKSRSKFHFLTHPPIPTIPPLPNKPQLLYRGWGGEVQDELQSFTGARTSTSRPPRPTPFQLFHRSI